MNSFQFHDMDEIIPNFLYLGNSASSRDIQKLKELGIKKVLTVMDFGAPSYTDKDNIIHKKISIADTYFENIIKYFGECLNFIKGKEKILVHCMAGASRSATIVIAYLMWSQKMSYSKALSFVKDKRFIIFPNPGFRDQLQVFEKNLIQNEYDIDKIKFDLIKWEPKTYGFF